MTASFIHYEQSEINYVHHGNGAINIICLHGYGECAASFNCLTNQLPIGYRTIAIDLPFHGSTLWNEARPFTIADLALVIEKILAELAITQKAFILLGYSMGGRIALSLLQHTPETILKLVLLAPDGMSMNPWYWLATQTEKGNQVFRFTMANPGWLKKILSVCNRFKLINKSIYKFITTYVEDDDIRNQLYQRWTCMRTFKPDLKKIRVSILQEKVPVKMLYGRHDRIIHAKTAIKFCKGLESICAVEVIEAGHNVLQEKHAGVIAKLITT